MTASKSAARPFATMARAATLFFLVALTFFTSSEAMAACDTLTRETTVGQITGGTAVLEPYVNTPKYDVKLNPNVTYQVPNSVRRTGTSTWSDTDYLVQNASYATEYTIQNRIFQQWYSYQTASFQTVQDYRPFLWHEIEWQWVVSRHHTNIFERRPDTWNTTLRECDAAWYVAEPDCQAGHNIGAGWHWRTHWTTDIWSAPVFWERSAPPWATPNVRRTGAERDLYGDWTHGPIGSVPGNAQRGNIWQKNVGWNALVTSTSLPGGREGVDYRINDRWTTPAGWGSTYTSWAMPASGGGRDWQVIAERAVRNGFSSTSTWMDNPPAGTANVDYRIMDTRTNYYSQPYDYVDNSPIWVSDPAGRTVLATNYDFSNSPTVTVNALPAGKVNVDYQLVNTRLERTSNSAGRVTSRVFDLAGLNNTSSNQASVALTNLTTQVSSFLATSNATTPLSGWTLVPGSLALVTTERTVQLTAGQSVWDYSPNPSTPTQVLFAALPPMTCEVNPT